MAFALVPAAHAGRHRARSTAHGTEEQKAELPHQAGLRRVDRHDEPHRARRGLRRRRAPHEGGASRTTAPTGSPGTKIFITFGEHDLAENIVHLVLARTPDAPPGTKGISLLHRAEVPRRRRRHARASATTVNVVSIEHKMGIQASPTCVLAYDGRRRLPRRRGAAGHARHVHDDEQRPPARRRRGPRSVRGRLPAALEYAKERRQGRALGAPGGDASPHRRAPRRPPHAADDEGAHRGDAAPLLLQRPAGRPRPPPPATPTARPRRRAGSSCSPRCRRLVHRPRQRGHQPRRPGARRHGLHRGDRRRPALPRRAHHRDLRGHQRHPGDGPRAPQGPAPRRRRPA